MARHRLKNRLAITRSAGLEKTQSTASGHKRKTYDALEHTRNRMGLKPAIETRPGTHCAPELSWWPRMRLIFREPLLEFWGVLVMMLLGGSVTAVTVSQLTRLQHLGRQHHPMPFHRLPSTVPKINVAGGSVIDSSQYLSNYQNGNWLTICFGWSAAMIFGIYVAGDSGAYLNPAITLTNCLFRGLPLRRWPVYAVAQLLGAFCGHGLVYANYISAVDQYEGHAIRTIPPSPTTSAKIFCQFPQPFVPLGSQIFSEFIANFFTTFLILAVRDENGADLKGGGFFVLAFFWLNFVVMAAFGWETGSPINPARDLTGRLWLAILGYKNAWSAYNYYFWIPFFVPFFACFCGALTYDIFIYTGDSPVNNGAWSLGNLRKGVTKMWDTIRARFTRGSRVHQPDEESQGAKQDQGTAASTNITEKGERKPSRPSIQGNESGRNYQETGSDTVEADCEENVEEDPNVNFTNARKAGYHGQPWEETEKTEKTPESKKDKETGRDDPKPDVAENDAGEWVDERGNEA